MKLNFHNLRTKFIILGGLLLFLSLSALGGIGYYSANKYLRISEDESMQLITDNYVMRIESNFAKVQMHLESVADTARVKEAKTKEGIVQALNDGMKRMPELALISYIDLKGSSLRPDGKTVYLGDRVYFKKVLETRKACVSEVIQSTSTKKLSVMIAVPAVSQGKLTGVIVGTYTIDQMQAMLNGINLKETGYGYLLDGKGNLIAHGTKPELAGKLNVLGDTALLGEKGADLGVEIKHLYQTALETGKEAFGAYSFDGIRQLAAIRPIPLTGGNQLAFAIAAPEGEVMALIDTLRNTMLAITFICMALTIILVGYLSGKFTKPIVEIERQLGEIAKGNLALNKLEIHSQDEIGRLASSCNTMAENIKSLIMKIQKTTEQVAAASEELTASADQSAQVTGQIAQTIAEVAASSARQLESVDASSETIDNMSGTIKSVADKMSFSTEQAAIAVGAAKNGTTYIDNAVKQMNNIESTVERSAEVVTGLGERSKEIGKIVSTISGIASQTNLLALNAAIEAARAGEQGKGFAVVAEEVRKLAEQSGEAAEEITKLINEIRKDTDLAVMAMNDGTGEVKIGAGVVAEAGKAFTEIVASIQDVSAGIDEISNNVADISSGAEQIVDAIHGIDKQSKGITAETQTVSAATEEQSAAMEEIASASRTLAALAQELQVAASKFHL